MKNFPSVSSSMDMAANLLLTTATPLAGAEEAEVISRRHFGVAGRAKLLSGEKDLNFKIVSDIGQEFVLKVTNTAEDRIVTDLSTKALQHIEAFRPDLPVPRVIQALDGTSEAVVTLNGTSHIVRLLTYLQGAPVHTTVSTAPQRRALGEFLANVGLVLQTFTHPAEDHEILWDLKHTERLLTLTSFIPDQERRQTAQHFIEVYLDSVKPIEPQLRSQIVHNDFNPHNVLVDPVSQSEVTGLLDFGDMVATPLINDVAIAASYLTPDTGHPLAYASEFVAAYNEVRPLKPAEIDVLFDLIAARHAMLITITEWRASLNPDNQSYILKNTHRASRGMHLCASMTRILGRDVFRRACRMEPAL